MVGGRILSQDDGGVYLFEYRTNRATWLRGRRITHSDISGHYYLCDCSGRRRRTVSGLDEMVPENENQSTKLVLLSYLRVNRAAGDADAGASLSDPPPKDTNFPPIF